LKKKKQWLRQLLRRLYKCWQWSRPNRNRKPEKSKLQPKLLPRGKQQRRRWQQKPLTRKD
jgi:hypothetical protein